MLETSFLVDLLKGTPRARKKAERLEQTEAPLTVSAITAFEIWVGALRQTRKSDEESKVEELLRTLRVIPFSEQTARESGSLLARLYEEGNPIQPEDAMIAGTAILNGETLITKNTEHYSRIPDVRLESY